MSDDKELAVSFFSCLLMNLYLMTLLQATAFQQQEVVTPFLVGTINMTEMHVVVETQTQLPDDRNPESSDFKILLKST